MKKFFFFAAALVASVTVNAQYISLSHDGLNADAVTAVTAGTSFGSNDAIAVSAAFDDSYKLVGVKHEGFYDFQIDDAAVGVDTIGIQGNTNPKDAEGNGPAGKCTVPVSGAVFKIAASANGWIYVFHKATSSKQYVVYENEIPIGYKFGMITTDANGYFGEANSLFPIEYEIVGNNDLNQITDQRKIEFVEDYAKLAINPEATTIGKKDYARNGLAVIAFPAYNECTYMVCAVGSKMSATGVAFYAAEKDVYVLSNAEGAQPVKIYTAGVHDALNNVEGAVKAQKVIRNGQVLIIKEGVAYTVLGTVAK